MSLAVITNLLRPGEPLYDFLVTELNSSPVNERMAMEVRTQIVGRFIGDEFKAEKGLRQATQESIRYLADALADRIFHLTATSRGEFVDRCAAIAERWIVRRPSTPRA